MGLITLQNLLEFVTIVVKVCMSLELLRIAGNANGNGEVRVGNLTALLS